GAGAGNTTISGGILFTIITKATGGTPAGFFRLSGFQFMSTGGCRGGTDGGAWSFVGGTSANVRLDHNAWIGNVSCPMLQINSNPGDNIFGVADHNTFTVNAPIVILSIFDFEGNTHGDDSWARADNMGSAQIFYFEDNTITNNHPNFHVTDGWR